ncbi:MAG: hypothetical protein AAFV19_18985 [Pseudomonadota bacterium]
MRDGANDAGPGAAEDGRGRSLPLLSVALIAVMALELMHLFSGIGAARQAAHGAMILATVAAIPRLGLREAYLLALSGVLVWLVLTGSDAPGEILRIALDQAVFLMSFILCLSLVQEAAMTSGSVARLGLYLSRQPGGRRFLGLYGGTNLMTVVFNLGTMSLLAPLIRRSAEAAKDDPLTPVRERRQLSAVLRGFAWSVVWSPTAVAPLAMMSLMEGIDRARWIAIGFCLSLVMMAVGWAEDKVTWRRYTAAAQGTAPIAPQPLPVAALVRFLTVCGIFGGLSVAVMLFGGLGLPPGLMAAAPVLLVGWLWVQSAGQGPGDSGGRLAITARRIREIAGQSLPLSAPAAVTLACSGFIGRAGAALIPAEEWAAAIGLNDMPAWLFLFGTTVAVTALSQLALSPIMMAVFFGAVLGALPSLPADPTLTALAIAVGWATSTTFSPFASGVILLTRVTGHPGTRLTYVWNGVFTALSFAVLFVVFRLLAET